MTDTHKKWIAGLGVLSFVLLSGLVFWYAGKPLIQFVSEPELFQAWVDSHGIWSRLAFLGMVVLQVFVAVIPGEPLEIAAGYAFGFWEGTFLCILGMTIGGMLIFSFVRRFGRKAAEVFIPQQKLESLRFLQNNRRITLIMVLVFLLPGTPKDLLSYFAGLTNIRTCHWLLITSVCRLPSVVTSTIGGDALGEGLIPQALAVFLFTILLSLIGAWLYHRFGSQHDRSK